MKTVKIKAGTEVRVRYIIGETVFDVVKTLANGNLYFTKDAYVQGETYKDGFYHLRQAREILPKKLGKNEFKKWPRLRKACHMAGIRRINVPGDGIPIHYSDELVVADFSMSGSHFFVIKKRDISSLLDLVPLTDEAKQKQKEIEKEKQKEWEKEQYKRFAPKAIAEQIGSFFWSGKSTNFCMKKYEFVKFIFESWEGEKKSIIFCEKSDIIHDGCYNVPKVKVEGKNFYLHGWTAGKISPDSHNRIKTEYCDGWGRNIAYLLPAQCSADVVTHNDRWLSLFDTEQYEENIPAEFIATCKTIYVEFYDLADRLIEALSFYVPDLLKQLR